MAALTALREAGKGDEAARWVADFVAAATLCEGIGGLVEQLQPKAIADAGEDCARQAFILNPSRVTARRLSAELKLEAGRALITDRALVAEYDLQER